MSERLSYTVGQLAEATGLNEFTIRAAYGSGALKVRYAGENGGRVLILAEDAKAWLESLPTEKAS